MFQTGKRKILFLFGLAIVAYILVTVLFQIDSTAVFASKKQESFIVEPPYHINRTGKHCEVSFEWGEMCPKLYTELGGRCDLVDDKFQCPDIRNYSKFLNRRSQLVITRMLRIFDLLAQKHGMTSTG